MANKSERRKEQAARRIARKQSQHQPGGGKYARKEKYLNAHGGWGWEYPEPKPWK